MTRLTATIAMRPPRRLQRLWYRHLGITPPLATGATGPRSADLVRLIPYRWRAIHRLYATTHQFFWIPCVLCDQPFGGHEAGASVPDPIQGERFSIMICSRCTRARRGAAA